MSPSPEAHKGVGASATANVARWGGRWPVGYRAKTDEARPTAYDAQILQRGSVSRIRYVSDTDTPRIRLGYVSRPYYENWIRIDQDTVIRHVWADLDTAHERKLAQLNSTRDLFPFSTSPARWRTLAISRLPPRRARREWQLAAAGGRRPAATLPDPGSLLLQLYAGVPLLGGWSKEHPWAARRQIGRRQSSQRPAAT